MVCHERRLSIIAGFVKACGKGLKGFFRWVEELIKGLKSGKGKSGEEVLGDVEKAVGMAENIKTTINVEEFLASAKRLENIKPEEALKYLDEALIHFNHEVVDDVVIQISDSNCAVVVQNVLEYLKTGKIQKATHSEAWELDKLNDLFTKTFREASISSIQKLMKEGDVGIIAGLRPFPKKGHVFNAIKINGKIKFIDGQNGGLANLNDGYIKFKYLITN